MNCVKCAFLQRTFDGYTHKLVCTATKRGRCIDYHMCTGQVVDGHFIEDNISVINDYFKSRLNRLTTPKWCPQLKE